MPLTSSFLIPTRATLRLALLVAGLSTGAAACAAQSASVDTAPAAAPRAVSMRPVQLHAGDLVKLYMWREPDLSREYEVNGAGAIDLPKVGAVSVAGVSPDSLQHILEQRYAKYLRTPTIEVTMRRRISVLGAVRNPGVYQVDPYVTVAAALALAGGTTPEARTDEVRVLRGDRTFRTRVSTRTVIADSPVESGDQLFVPDRGWATRNIAVISAAVSAVGIIVFAARR